MLASLALVIYVVALAAAGINDLVRYEIPNGLSLALVGAFALYAPSLPLPILVAHATAGLAVLAVVALGFAVGLMGGGDAKLLTATSLWMGWDALLPFILLTALVGGAITLILLVLRKLLARRAPSGGWLGRLLAPTSGVPYGLAIAVAGLTLFSRLGVAEMSRAAG
jgi:prepilin peptidase CpaA